MPNGRRNTEFVNFPLITKLLRKIYSVNKNLARTLAKDEKSFFQTVREKLGIDTVWQFAVREKLGNDTVWHLKNISISRTN